MNAVQKNKKNTTSAAIDNSHTPDRPLDYSYKKLTTVAEAIGETPRAEQKAEPPKDEDGKYNTQSLKLANNQIAELGDLHASVESLILYPNNLRWIDLSFNELTVIDPILTSFTELTVLYLHGNQIKEIKEVDKLDAMKKLTKLTLHGNGLEKTPDYKKYVLSTVPTLNKLDFSGITKNDQATSETWRKSRKAKTKKKNLD